MDVKALKVSLVFAGLVLTACAPPGKLASATNPLQSAECLGTQAIKSEVIVSWEDGHHTVEKVDDIDTFIDQFVKPQIDQIKLVQYNQKVQAQDIVNGPISATTTDSTTWGQEKIQVQQLWDQGIQGQNVLVGVVDTFIDDNHSQLHNSIAYNLNEIANNGIDDDKNGEVDDYRGFDHTGDHTNFYNEDTKTTDAYQNPHGSHVSGIIAGEHTSAGNFGIAPKAKIIMGSFLDHYGSGDQAMVLKALDYVVNRGARIINASWAMNNQCNIALRSALEGYDAKGVMFVAAAGNGDTNGRAYNLDTTAVSPASFRLPRQITVGASTSDDYATSFSNFSESLVHLTAPGMYIYSSLSGNSWGTMSGTSMAAPFVTGVAALLMGAYPNADALKIKQAILDSVDVIPGKESKTMTHGRLNAAKAYTRLQQLMSQ